jgi:ceramide glucosyltransferase
MVAILILVLVASAGLVLSIIATLQTYKLIRNPAYGKFYFATAAEPAVSILKPLCGLDDELATNLESVLKSTGVSSEVIISVADEEDPAVGIARTVTGRFPEVTSQLIIGNTESVDCVNLKVERLLAAESQARGEVLVISDSNVRMRPDDLRKTLDSLDSPEIGCVMNLFVGAGAETLGARLESLHLLNHILPGTVLAHAFGIPVIIGKSIAVPREALEKVGGLEAFSHRLAEDQCLGLALSEAGYQLVLSPVVVENVTVKRSVKEVFGRQVRWARIRYSFSRFTYAIEFLGVPFPLSLLASLIAAAFEPSLLAPALFFTTGVLIFRIATTSILASITGARIRWTWLPLIALQDCIQFLVQLSPYLSSEVNWRGTRIRIGRDTLITESHRGRCYPEEPRVRPAAELRTSSQPRRLNSPRTG